MIHNKTFEGIYVSDKHSDIEIAMDLVSKYYLIQDSILVKFKRKAKETLLQKASSLIHSITNSTARRLLMLIIKKENEIEMKHTMQLNSEFLETCESEKSKFRCGRILLMDDDDLVREITELMLERLGYDSEVSQEGTEAMNLYEKAMNSVYPFNAVIIDLKVKAGLDGLDTIKGLKVMDPQVKAIVSSGFTNDPVMTNFKEYGFQGVLPKPYKMKDIEDALFKISTEWEN